ncbi:MAG: indolepyruvate oxidoreductase subunit beta family protein [Sphingopyxis sp.]|nr:indolepyruvate oxidoreductase subunit beta family protein [Sphingopyxis sp.]
MTDSRNMISIAILALGGQGGGVLAEWIQEVARHHGWLAQGTSVPGVAQRTGSTVYYVELARADADGRLPVMAQMPMPGDVDIVIASELMETGRALLRGFSTAGRTTLIGSTHRVYAISEKAAMGDGRGSSDRIMEAAGQRSARFIGFDMDAATERAGSVISAIMFGALGGSEALPFPRETFEQAIRDSGIAVPSNLKGFDEGYRAAKGAVALPVEQEHAVPVPTTAKERALDARAQAMLAPVALSNALHGIARLMDYQDADYATLYLDRLERIAALDRAPHLLSAEAARYLALWMSYEDTIRVADLKTRASRITRVRSEVQAADGQIVDVTEYMHPRLQEIGETLPAPIGRILLGNGPLAKMLAPFFQQGRHVRTTSLRWFLMLRIVARMRGMRRASIRYMEEQARIEAWLALTEQLAISDTELALEWIRCQRLVKGYGDTFERGLRNFATVRDAFLALPDAQRNAEWLRQASAMALGDDEGKRLDGFLRAA